jgi:hypothetical protein
MMERDDGDEIQTHTAEKRGMIIERDARGKPISITVQSPFVIDRLFEFGIIDREQHWHAEQFVAMRKVFIRPVGSYKSVCSYQQPEQGHPPAKYPIEDNDYLKVLRDIRHKWQQDIVRLAAEDDEGADALMAYDPAKLSNAFWALTYAINRLLDKKKEVEDAKKAVARANDPCDTRFD